MIERDYREKVKQEAERRSARGQPPAEKGYDAPSQRALTSREKLDRANLNSTRPDNFVEPPLTDAERGMSETAFSKLPPQRRMEIWNRAMWARRQDPN